mmetsp:Transcript_19574/g.28478  ORF Transcript_19574/g.28478 Transcript_19574/m.28478 type:complete len:96 (-) Transcript_19574:885-1172(-)
MLNVSSNQVVPTITINMMILEIANHAPIIEPMVKISFKRHASGVGEGCARSEEMVKMVPSLRNAMISTRNGGKLICHTHAKMEKVDTIRTVVAQA